MFSNNFALNHPDSKKNLHRSTDEKTLSRDFLKSHLPIQINYDAVRKTQTKNAI